MIASSFKPEEPRRLEPLDLFVALDGRPIAEADRIGFRDRVRLLGAEPRINGYCDAGTPVATAAERGQDEGLYVRQRNP